MGRPPRIVMLAVLLALHVDPAHAEEAAGALIEVDASNKEPRTQSLPSEVLQQRDVATAYSAYVDELSRSRIATGAGLGVMGVGLVGAGLAIGSEHRWSLGLLIAGGTAIAMSPIVLMVRSSAERRVRRMTTDPVFQATQSDAVLLEIWKQEAKTAKTYRSISGIGGAILGTSLATAGVVQAITIEGDDQSSREQRNDAALLIGLGGAAASLAVFQLLTHSIVERRYNEFVSRTSATASLSAPTWAIFPLQHGGLLGVTGAF